MSLDIRVAYEIWDIEGNYVKTRFYKRLEALQYLEDYKKRIKSSPNPSQADWNKRQDAIDSVVNQYLESKGYVNRHVIFSAYDLDEKGLPKVESLSKVAFDGEVKLHYRGFGENLYTIEVVKPTWLELCFVAEQAIRFTGDNHHIFFEGIYEHEGQWWLAMGS